MAVASISFIWSSASLMPPHTAPTKSESMTNAAMRMKKIKKRADRNIWGVFA